MSSRDNNEDNALNTQSTGFLFGNIDENGELESNFLDNEARNQVESLSK